MEKYKKEIKEIRNNRNYDTAAIIKISKIAESYIIDVMDALNIEYEEAAELLLDIGMRNINCW